MVADRIFESVARLRDYPQSGRVVPEFEQPDLREIILGSYRIVYRVGDQHVAILTA